MKVDSHLLGLLADGQYHSGVSLSRNLSVSRAAIWKKIVTMRNMGIEINAVKGKGYRLGRKIEPLHYEKIQAVLPARTRKIISGISVLQSVDSTNNFLLNNINQPDFHAHAVLSEFQAAGRGRRGNAWLSPYAAGLYLSVGWHYQNPVETTGIISLATGVAIIKTLKKAGIKNAKLKWPNDIYYQDKKLGGILVEMRLESAGPCHLLVGVGINYAIPDSYRNNIKQPCIDLVSIDKTISSRNVLAGYLITEISDMLKNLQSCSLPEIINAWREHDCMPGKNAVLLLPDKNVEGKVNGIDQDGALLFTSGSVTKRYHSGEISLRGNIETTD